MPADPHDRPFRSALILGARGFLGRYLAAEFTRAGIHVHPLDIRDFAAGTVGQAECLAAATQQLQKKDAPDLIVHAAGLVGSDSEEALRTAHEESTRTLLEAVAKWNKAARVMVIGSAAELGLNGAGAHLVKEQEEGSPVSAYGRSKLNQSRIARESAVRHDLDLVRVRVFNTLGPGQSGALVAGAMIERLLEAQKSGLRTLNVHNPFHVRDYLDARDVARCIRCIAQRLPRNPARAPINICAGAGTTVAALAGELLAAANLEIAPTFTGTADAESRMVGDNTTLSDLLGDEPVQTIPTHRSLAEMWHVRVNSSHG